MVVVCGEFETKERKSKNNADDDVKTEATVKKYRKPRYVCGDGGEEEEEKRANNMMLSFMF